MKVILVNDYGQELGGAESYFFSLCQGLRNNGLEVISVTSDRRKKENQILSDYQLPHTGHCFNLDSLFHPGVYFCFRKIIKSFAPDIIHYNNLLYSLSPSALVAGAGVCRVQTLHDYTGICFGDKRRADGGICNEALCRCECKRVQVEFLSPVQKKIYHFFAKKIDTFIAPSLFLKEEFEKNGFLSVRHLAHFCGRFGVEEEGVSSLADAFLYLGRLAEQKGLEVLLRAYAKYLAQVKKPYPLLIAGEGPEERKLKSLAEELGLAEMVQFLGWVDKEKKAQLFSRSRAVVLPSIWPEVAGLSLYEAAGFSVPAIGSSVGGIGDFVRHEENGLLVEMGNVEELFLAMQRITVDEKLYRKLSLASREKYRECSLGEYCSSLLGIYSEILGR